MVYVFSSIAMKILTRAEQRDGGQLLFDAKTPKNSLELITGISKTWMDCKKWNLKGQRSNGTESGDAGDIVSLKKYKNYELVFDWKLGKGGNSGVALPSW